MVGAQLSDSIEQDRQWSVEEARPLNGDGLERDWAYLFMITSKQINSIGL